MLKETNFDDFYGKKIHLFLKNKYHYFCEIQSLREINNVTFLQIFDFRKNTTFLIDVKDIDKIEVVARK